MKWPEESVLLHKVSARVVFPDMAELITDLVLNMFKTMYDANGIGLSAIQVGVPLRVFVMDVYGKPWTFVNPSITCSGTKGLQNEGCLSVPGVVERVLRSPTVTVVAYDAAGNQFQKTFKDIEAQCIQHEFEHLDGTIIPDKLSDSARTKLAAEQRKAREQP